VILRLSVMSFVLLAIHSSAVYADGPGVGRDINQDSSPAVKVEDQQNRPGSKRNSHYSGVVPKESSGGGGGAPTTIPQLRSDSTMDEFVNAVCANPDQYFDEPTYIPACGELTGAPPAADTDNRAQAEAYARHYLQIVGLDKPRLEISAKNGGICGVEHSLDLHMRMERVFEDGDAPYGTLNIHAYAKAVVDWGDGSHGMYFTSGGPFPNKSIAHAWTDRGYYNINATATWSAAWSMGPYSGVLAGIPATGSIDNFRVWEAQAMIIK
jgi:hypothetical protein